MLTRAIVTPIKVMLTASIVLFVSAVCMTSGWSAVASEQAGSTQRFPRPNWDLKYNFGSLALQKNQWFKAAFSSGQPSDLKELALAIRVDYLREIYVDPKAEKDSDTLQHMARSGCAYAKYLMPNEKGALPPETFVVWPISPGTMRRTTEHLNARYPIRFVWNDGETEKELSFSVNSCEYASFLANLRWAAGQRWKEMERDLQK